jgi:hypothetical protein
MHGHSYPRAAISYLGRLGPVLLANAELFEFEETEEFEFDVEVVVDSSESLLPNDERAYDKRQYMY